MSMRRALGLGLLLVAALAVTGLVVVDRVAGSALEGALSRTFGTGVSVEAVDVGLFSDEMTAEGVVVANPEGFDSPHFASLSRLRVAAGLTDLLGDTVARVRMGAGEAATVEVAEIRLLDLGSGARGGLGLGEVAAAALEAAVRGTLSRSGGLPGLVGRLLRRNLVEGGDLPGVLEVGGSGGTPEEGGGRMEAAVEEILPGGG